MSSTIFGEWENSPESLVEDFSIRVNPKELDGRHSDERYHPEIQPCANSGFRSDLMLRALGAA